MAGEEMPQHLADAVEARGVQPRLAVDRREPGGEEQGVALAQRHLEVVGEVEQQLAAGP